MVLIKDCFKSSKCCAFSSINSLTISFAFWYVICVSDKMKKIFSLSMNDVKSVGRHLSQINLTWFLSVSVSSFLSRAIGLKFCTKKLTVSIVKLTLWKSSGLYLLYEAFVKRFLAFTLMVLYDFFLIFVSSLSSWKKSGSGWLSGGENELTYFCTSIFSSVSICWIACWFSVSLCSIIAWAIFFL